MSLRLPEVAYAAILFSLLGVATSLASQKTGTPDRDAAVAAALQEGLSDFMTDSEIYDKNPPYGFIVMCIESRIDLNIPAISSHLSETIIRPIRTETCTTNTVQGDFGMFTAMTNYYDPTGAEAGRVEVVGAKCVSTSECVVDLDFRGSGERYVVRRKGSNWGVTHRNVRWIV